MRQRYDPAFTARVILEKFSSGNLTIGEVLDCLYHLERLPERLRIWTWQQLEDRLGPDAAGYMQRWLRAHPTVMVRA